LFILPIWSIFFQVIVLLLKKATKDQRLLYCYPF
jgi:hypothetical protein